MALRGRGAGNTLVLLNGRRMPFHPFTAGAVSPVNINVLPSAVQQIAVLRDGASANFVYHSPIWTGSNASQASYDRLKDTVDYLRALYNNGALAYHEIGNKQTQLNLGLGYRWGAQARAWLRRTSVRVGVNNAQDREPTHSQAQTGYVGSLGRSQWIGRAYSLTCGRDF